MPVFVFPRLVAVFAPLVAGGSHNVFEQRASSNCTPSGTHGCLDGVAYDYATEFPCGSRGIYCFSDDSCCEQGRPFDFSSNYCFTGSGQTGLHSFEDGKCDLACPDNCQCYDDFAAANRSLVTRSSTPPTALLAQTPRTDSLVNTSDPSPGGYECNAKVDDETGCVNGWQYSYAKQAPCGNWLMEFGTYGCCPNSLGFFPYLIGITYCCKVEGAPVGQDYQIKTEPCSCQGVWSFFSWMCEIPLTKCPNTSQQISDTIHCRFLKSIGPSGGRS